MPSRAMTDLLGSLLEALPSPVFVKDEQHRWVLLNDSYCRFMGYPREALVGKSDHDFFPPHEAEVFWSRDDAVFATGQVDENEERFTDAAGREHVILTRKVLHTARDGRRFLVGIITDITDRKQIEEDLRLSRDELERRVSERTAELKWLNQQLRVADQRKNDFLGVLSHELRNPLAPILHALYVIDHSPPDGEQLGPALAVIHRQVDHLARLVDDLLDVTRISRGKVQLHRRVVDLADAVRRTAEDHRALFARREIALEVDVPPDERLHADADPTRVAQIVGNLLQNAAKFTNSGGTVRVSLARAPGGKAVIRVRDSGIGMSRETLRHVFEPFMQADDTLHRSSGGLGLGLALVKGLAALQGGTAEAHSDGPGHGSEVTVSLPLVAAPADAGTAARASSVAAAPSPAPPRRRVLVVEDNPDAADLLRVLLEMAGHEVALAHDGREGLARVRSLRPDVVLCDIGLPEMDGLELARQVRADPALADIKLVAVSGYALPEDQRRSLEAGFDLHLAKPVPLDRLTEILGPAIDSGLAWKAAGI